MPTARLQIPPARYGIAYPHQLQFGQSVRRRKRSVLLRGVRRLLARPTWRITTLIPFYLVRKAFRMGQLVC